YVLLNPDKSSKAIFGNLVQMIHHSRRLLFNDEATFEKTKTQNLDRLRGILAEYKVLVAVSEEWPKATIGTVEQDILGADIIIPDVSGGKRPVALQVKSSNGTNRDLEFIPRESRAPIVRVPMNITEHDPLSLSREHISRLHSYVKTAPRFRIAWAA
ncbi:MAG TPA: hypothetical protein VHL10_07070, partial [Nitrososphaera sp.]|nr:hypothetical protein [Nitrososphaera sp.]